MKIPEQLQKKKYKFVRLNWKVPIDKDWQKENNYQYDSNVLKEHKQNIGVCCGKGNLYVIDIDKNADETLNKLLEVLPKTYIVKTGKQGYHLFYEFDSHISTTCFEFGKSHIDIKSIGGQVVMEGSIHPETKNEYTCYMNKEIAVLSKTKFQETFQIEQNQGTTVKKNKEEDSTRSATEYRQICGLISKGKTKDQIYSYMNAFDKWKHSPDKYKEYTYNKALNFIESKKKEPVSSENIKYKVLELLCDTDKNTKYSSYLEAEELLVSYLISKFKFRTIQQDEKFEVWGYQEGIYLNIGQSLAREELRKILGRAFSQNIVTKVINKLTADTYINPKDFFKQEEPYLLPVNNGILDLKTLKLSAFDPEKIFFSKLPVDYNPESECPHIKQHLKNVLNDQSDVLLLQEALGNCLLKKYTFQKAVMMVGSGRNGKGITLQLLTHLLGSHNTSAVTLEQLETDQYALSGLHGKLANIGGDLNKTSLKNTGQFKSASGGDLISAPRKFMTPIDFENYAKFFFACNELPLIYDQSRGFWDRWLYFEFPFTFIPLEEYKSKIDKSSFKIADPLIKDKIFNDVEIQGFLNFAISGLKRLLENNCFSTSETFEAVKEKWINQSDSFKAFTSKHIEQDFDSETEKKTLRFAYHRYCKDKKVKPLSDKHIFKVLSEEYSADIRETKVMGEKTRYWMGVKLK